jgi:excinuclease UvrABC ATPase subunit
VITGLSGSGKSSLAFDTIYAEGQRRYVESLSAYARQFLSLMEKPDVDHIEGLSPAISIEQKATSHNPRSTVGTITEIYDYLRLLFARVGLPKCPKHGVDKLQLFYQHNNNMNKYKRILLKLSGEALAQGDNTLDPKLVVITGLSGSGKSSLAFDTIYAEGQRRYVESLSAYARQVW